MFRCGQCGRTTSLGEKARRLVVKTRTVIYPGGHRGTEIVKEIMVCGKCLIKSKKPPIGIVYAPYIPKSTGWKDVNKGRV